MVRLDLPVRNFHSYLLKLTISEYSASQSRLEQKLDKFMREVRAGLREGSVVSVEMLESLSTDEKDLWRCLRRELKDIGYRQRFLQSGRTL